MSTAPQGFFWWPGIETFLHGSFSLTHGITPSVCQIYIAPQLNWPDTVGDLTVNYQPGGLSCYFAECLLDFVSIEAQEDGRQVWGLHILDRRWKWKDCGRISGNYNVRRANGDGDSEIVPATAVPVADLMALCLDAMGEDVYGYDISQVVEEDYPEIDWDYENPSQVLLKLCDEYGYRVVLSLQGQVVIAVTNEGNYLPAVEYMSGSTELNPANTPSAIVAVAGKTVVQYDFPLEAVGIELDGSIVPIDQLSYTPVNGWGNADLPQMNCINNATARSYATRSVFKYYRIVPDFIFAGVDQKKPTNDDVPDPIFVLPLYNVQLDKDAPGPDGATPRKAWVYGIWFTFQNAFKNSTNVLDCTITAPDKSVCPETDYTLDAKTGIVVFTNATVSVDPALGAPRIKYPAILMLRTSCNVRDQQTMGWLRHEKQYDLSTAATFTQPMYAKHDDVALKITYRFDQGGVPISSDDNSQEVDDASNYYIAAALKTLTFEDPQTFEYAGFVFIDLDGAIQQITWNVDEEGKATTQYNRNKEDLVNTPSYEEAKQAALLKMALLKAARTDRVKQQDMLLNLTIVGMGGGF